jgi:hypothetical protein
VDAATNGGFACLKFRLEMPQYYMYSYESTAGAFVATAQGDLNGNGVPSQFAIRGKVSNDVLVVNPNVETKNPEE